MNRPQYAPAIDSLKNVLHQIKWIIPAALAAGMLFSCESNTIEEVLIYSKADNEPLRKLVGSPYLLAVDYYNKAKSVDNSVADKASQKAAGYKKYFPTNENVFFNNLNVGDSYTVECFGESTTIRTSD